MLDPGVNYTPIRIWGGGCFYMKYHTEYSFMCRSKKRDSEIHHARATDIHSFTSNCSKHWHLCSLYRCKVSYNACHSRLYTVITIPDPVPVNSSVAMQIGCSTSITRDLQSEGMRLCVIVPHSSYSHVMCVPCGEGREVGGYTFQRFRFTAVLGLNVQVLISWTPSSPSKIRLGCRRASQRD
jgi:hypothetical protein